MFLLVSVRRVGAHSGGHQHGVSLQIFINLGKTFLRISRIRNILLTWILARVFGLYLLNEFDFYFDLFWMAWHWKPAIGEDAKVKGARKVDRAGKSPSSPQFHPTSWGTETANRRNKVIDNKYHVPKTTDFVSVTSRLRDYFSRTQSCITVNDFNITVSTCRWKSRAWLQMNSD